MRVVTWNIHGCVGSRGTFDPHATTSVLRRIRADILALQEVDARSERALGFDSFTHFARHDGGYAAEARTITGEGGDYGHMVISRWAIRRHTVHDVTHSVRETRMIIEAYIDRNRRPFRVLAVHLGLKPRERREQIDALLEIIRRDDETPTLLLGDFNHVRRRGRLQRMLTPSFGFASAPATFPARRPIFALDRIWARPAHLIGSTWAFKEARDASDHLPLVADLDLLNEPDATNDIPENPAGRR